MNARDPQPASPDVELMTAWRHAIHQHPELGFEETCTSALVADRLQAWGYEVTTGIAATGVVGCLRWGEDGNGLRLGLRADMDALPIEEATGLPWCSQSPGTMHACGHDGHTAMLLGAAQVLALHAAEGRLGACGTLNLIFQPAEELGGGGGARRMIEEGLFESFPCDAIFGMHNYPGMPTGRLYFRSGPFMASSDKVLIRFHGKGGHGAMPHLAVDPTLPAAATVLALQGIVARNIDPIKGIAVISVGRMAAGRTYNVIPEVAELELSVRALDPDIRRQLQERIVAVVDGQAASYGVRAEIRYEHGYPVLVNAAAETRFAVEAAQAVFGAEQVDADALPLAGSEDFAFMLQQVPGCYLMIGNGDNGHDAGQPSGPCSVHDPHYDFNDRCLPLGAAYWVSLATRFFSLYPRRNNP
jgi:hippurate hydrolase